MNPTIESEGDLVEVLKAAGSRHGYVNVEARFRAFPRISLKWRRCATSIAFEVSDYLRGAPCDAVDQLAEDAFTRMESFGERKAAAPAMDAWLSSPKFALANQRTFVTRTGFFDLRLVGRLEASYSRLKAMGLAHDDAALRIGWTSGCGDDPGTCDVPMRTVAVNVRLDGDDVPDDVLDYALWTQIAHVDLGQGPEGPSRMEAYDARLGMFPDRAGAASRLGYHLEAGHEGLRRREDARGRRRAVHQRPPPPPGRRRARGARRLRHQRARVRVRDHPRRPVHIGRRRGPRRGGGGTTAPSREELLATVDDAAAACWRAYGLLGDAMFELGLAGDEEAVAALAPLHDALLAASDEGRAAYGRVAARKDAAPGIGKKREKEERKERGRWRR